MRPICVSRSWTASSSRDTGPAPTTGLGRLGALPPPSVASRTSAAREVPEPIDIAPRERRKKLRGQLCVLPSIGVEPGKPRVHVRAGSHSQLTAGRLGPLDHRRDLGDRNPNTSRRTNTALSSGLSRSSSSRAAIDTDSASSAARSGSRWGSSSSGSGSHSPTYCTRRIRAERNSLIDRRVTMVARNASADSGCVAAASKRSHASCTTSSASLTPLRRRYAIENNRGRSSSNSPSAVM